MATKYRNIPVTLNGEVYRSQKEWRRHKELVMLQKAGHIAGLLREVSFVLAPKVHIDGEKRARPEMRYIADFVYSDVHTGQIVVEDAKGFRTPVFRLKKHLMATVCGVHVQEV